MSHRGYPWIVCGIDAPLVLDCTVTPIPSSVSLPLQVVASMPNDISHLYIADAVGQYVGVYTGSIGSEKWACTIAGGGFIQIPNTILKGQRVSLRNMVAGVISTGSLSIMFGRNE